MTTSMPTLCDVAQDLYAALPPKWTESDENYGWPLAVLCDALTRPGMQPLFEYAMDKPDGTPGWANLLSLNTVTARQAKWLGQFVGVQVPDGLTDDAARELIAERPGYARGRPSAIISAIKTTLTGGKFVDLVERDTSPYHHTVYVYASEVPSEDAVRAIIAKVKPAMDIIDLVVRTGPTYGDIRSSLPSDNYGARETEYPTYGDIKEYAP